MLSRKLTILANYSSRRRTVNLETGFLILSSSSLKHPSSFSNEVKTEVGFNEQEERINCVQETKNKE